jgi:pimeloyl-ACP methyl ester carboxylesterase
VRSPTGALPRRVEAFGETALGTRVLTSDHVVEVPLDHADPGGERIEVYAREVRASDLADADQPYLLFLQGGPGGRSPRPGADGPGWLGWALRRYRVLLLDQRGTGRSTPQDRHTLAARAPREQAERLALFRADAIVADAEVLRRHLLGDVPWTVLGQSFGGFCTWTYLSFAPHGLTAGYVTGGVPPVGAHADDVYRATRRAVERRAAELDADHPQARAVLADVARHLLAGAEEHLPTGERLTVTRLQEVGQVLGSAPGPDLLAQLAEDAWAAPGRLSDTFLTAVAGIVSYATNPLYALVHEACYAGPGDVTGWSWQRVRAELGIAAEPSGEADGVERLPLTGENVHRSSVAADPALAPLAEVADLLAERTWDRPLYDPDRLARNAVPVVACLYARDMYVDPALSRAAADAAAAVTVVEDDVRHHDGLRRSGPEVLDRLEAALLRVAPDAVAPAAPAAPDPADAPAAPDPAEASA